MREGGRTVWAMTGVVLLAVGLGCGGDGGGPTDPGNGNGNGLSVSGTWDVTATLDEEDCPEEVAEVQTGTVQIEQNGTQVTFRQGALEASGMLDLETGDFSISGTVVSIDGTILIMESGRFSSSSMYTSTSTFTFQPIAEPSCMVRTNDVGVRR